ncbi:MAG TPA: MFS transporter, partial [Gammaproteobacteria bacterium]|nr:MFS transporter [Gammaproteobacteria bacterium]
MSHPVTVGSDPRELSPGEVRRVIFASSLGTVFEWYDFYLYGSLASFITKHFFSGVNETTGYIFALLAFAAGFAVRPFGALIFGRLGDKWGRKNTFLVTMLLMGLSTFAVGLLPSYDSVGVIAPVALISLRLVQGLALGGEYGGAATYVAEHVPDDRRGFYTSFIQTTATLGLFVSLLVILGVRNAMPSAAFEAWGWRIPFLLSIVLVTVSYLVRRRLQESPLFAALKAQGKTSSAPIRESYGSAERWKVFFIVLFGAAAGQAVVWYTGQFYALLFVQTTLKITPNLAYFIVAGALAVGTPFFLVFGALSDRIGRKKVMLAGNLL